MKLTVCDLEKILYIGIALTTEKNYNKLLAHILDEAMEVTHCDGATLYLYEEQVLKFRIMKTLSMDISRGDKGETIEDMPPVAFTESNVCAYSGIHREIVNIADVYNSDKFDFSGPKNYDRLTGYRTQSMLVIPLENDARELIGVLQLLNAMDEGGNVIPFHSQYEMIIRSLGALTAIKLTNIRYLNQIKLQLRSFVEAFATAIDERTPYNGSHTRKVADYVMIMAKKVNKKYEEGLTDTYFDEERMEKLYLAALLHDIGKMIVPRSVMNRARRLEHRMEGIISRFELIKMYYRVDFLEGKISRDEYGSHCRELDEILDFIKKVDVSGFLDDEVLEKVRKISEKKYEGEKTIPYLTEEEREALLIRKGTLSAADRKIMESHVVMTGKILEKVHFDKTYQDVPRWAAEHHELLDGSGYPNGIRGEEIDIETRMITIADIYDAMTATDRPYKKPTPREKVFKIQLEMAEEGKLDKQLVQWFQEALMEV